MVNQFSCHARFLEYTENSDKSNDKSFNSYSPFLDIVATLSTKSYFDYLPEFNENRRDRLIAQNEEDRKHYYESRGT